MSDEKRKLHPARKAAWLYALRSGDYLQGQGQLKIETEEGPRYCCLGVACEVSGVGQWDFNGDFESYRTGRFQDGNAAEYDDRSWSTLTRRVAGWLQGVDGVSVVTDFTVEYLGVTDFTVEYLGERRLLSGLNDEGVSFSTIADLIEEQL
jgi:hypothetical protein